MISRTAFACLFVMVSSGTAFAEPRVEIVENPDLIIVDATIGEEREWVRNSPAYGYQTPETEYGLSLFKLMFEAPIPVPRPDYPGVSPTVSKPAKKTPIVADRRTKAKAVKVAERRLTLPLKPIIGVYN